MFLCKIVLCERSNKILKFSFFCLIKYQNSVIFIATWLTKVFVYCKLHTQPRRRHNCHSISPNLNIGQTGDTTYVHFIKLPLIDSGYTIPANNALVFNMNSIQLIYFAWTSFAGFPLVKAITPSHLASKTVYNGATKKTRNSRRRWPPSLKKTPTCVGNTKPSINDVGEGS